MNNPTIISSKYDANEVMNKLLDDDRGLFYFQQAIQDNNFNPNQILAKNNEFTALFLTMSWDNKKIFNLLVKSDRTDVNKELIGGDSYPLFYACFAYITKGEEYFVKQLLTRKDLNVNKTAKKCSPCLFYAIAAKNTPLIALLLQRPDIDLSLKHDGDTPYECAYRLCLYDIANMIKKREMNKTNEKVCF